MRTPSRIVDISQPISSTTTCFPGDIPFSKQVTVTYPESQVINLTAFTMSPHVGTHADAPVHVQGDLEHSNEAVGTMALVSFIGPTVVVDVSPWTQAITWSQVKDVLLSIPLFPERILFKTARQIRYDVFENEYASFSPELIQELGKRNVRLVGIDTPSVDPIDSKTLDSHHALLEHHMAWLENLDLTTVQSNTPKDYFLSALPLKLMELEASPVRAVLLEFDSP